MDRRDLPDVVRLPDGRAEPFAPERITRSLFEAAGRVGKADPFLARELTEGVLHFLAADRSGSAVSPAEIADVVGKVVRELGHPDLARAFETRLAAPPEPARTTRPDWPDWVRPADGASGLTRLAAAGPLEAFSLAHLYPPELASAHTEGLIRLTGLCTPFELAGVTVGLSPRGALEAIRRGRDIAGEFLAVDGPEYDLAAESGDPARLAAGFLREVRFAAESLGLTIVLNVNIQAPPPRLARGSGPLFQSDPAAETERRNAIAGHLAAGAPGGVTVWWHLGDEPHHMPLAGARCELVFDRPRGPVALAPGIDRMCPAALAVVGVHMDRLVQLTGGPPVDPAVFLKKVGSLARFAKTAGHVKQDFLRRHGRPGVREAFLLDRARLVLVPLGLREAARASDRPPAEFARDILKALRTAAETDRPRALPVRVDSPLGDWGQLDIAEPGLPVKAQVRAASPLHHAAGGGRVNLRPPEGGFSPDEFPAAVRAAAAGSVARIRLGE